MFENNQIRESFDTTANLSAHQFHIMRLSAANVVSQANSAGQIQQVGVLQNNPDGTNGNQAATVAMLGMTRIVAGSSFAAGDKITTSASGRAVGVTSGAYVIGQAIEAATLDGDIVTVWLERPWKFAG